MPLQVCRVKAMAPGTFIGFMSIGTNQGHMCKSSPHCKENGHGGKRRGLECSGHSKKGKNNNKIT